MKRNLLFVFPVIVMALLLMAYSGNNSRYPNGSPAGYTGSPGDGANCTECHGGSASTVDGWITSDIPPQGYFPGYTYLITVTVSGNGDKGFLVSPQDISGSQLGSMASGSGNKLVGSGKYVTQTSSTSQNPKVWTFSWTAPEAGTGDVTFYGAFTVNKPVTKLSTLTVGEDMTTSINDPANSQFRIYPNPAIDFVNISFDQIGELPYEINLYAIDGRKIASLNENQVLSDNRNIRMELSNQLMGGLYISEMVFRNEKVTRKIIIK